MKVIDAQIRSGPYTDFSLRYWVDDDGAVFFSFVGELNREHRAYTEGYTYDHGGDLYRAAVDNAVALGLLNKEQEHDKNRVDTPGGVEAAGAG